MTWEHFAGLLEHHLDRRPFRPFVVDLHGEKRYEVDHPHSVAVKDGVAAFIAPGGVPVWFDHESVIQIVDAPSETAP